MDLRPIVNPVLILGHLSLTANFVQIARTLPPIPLARACTLEKDTCIMHQLHVGT